MYFLYRVVKYTYLFLTISVSLGSLTTTIHTIDKYIL